jgi:hypothetical protein
MRYQLSINYIEEYAMGDPYAGKCIANDEHGKKYFICNMAMDNIFEYQSNIFILPILVTRPIDDGTQIINQRCVRIAQVNMNTKVFICYEKYYAGILEFSKHNNELHIAKQNSTLQAEHFDLSAKAIVYTHKIADRLYTAYYEKGNEHNTWWYCAYDGNGKLLRQIQEIIDVTTNYWDAITQTEPLAMPTINTGMVYNIYEEDFENMWRKVRD